MASTKITGEELRTLIAAHMAHWQSSSDCGRIAQWGDLDLSVRRAYNDLAKRLTFHDEETP